MGKQRRGVQWPLGERQNDWRGNQSAVGWMQTAGSVPGRRAARLGGKGMYVLVFINHMFVSNFLIPYCHYILDIFWWRSVHRVFQK